MKADTISLENVRPMQWRGDASASEMAEKSVGISNRNGWRRCAALRLSYSCGLPSANGWPALCREVHIKSLREESTQ
jgi:hypothetical protein